MKIHLPYGKGRVEVDAPQGANVAYPKELPRVGNVGDEIRRAMATPIGSLPLRAIASGKRDAVVVINDITRPAPSREMLAAILEELQIAGVPEAMVTVFIATGNHRSNSPAEIAQMIGASRETVTRLFADFKRKHFLEVHGSTLILKDKAGLEEVLQHK